MKYLILILCVLFCFYSKSQAQERQEDETKKQEKKIKVPIKTLEEYEQEELKEKTQYKPDIVGFNSRKKPIDNTILDLNKNFQKSIELNTEVYKGKILESLELTNISCVRIAEKTGQFVILNPIDVYTAKLSYYSLQGKQIWERYLNFSEQGTDLSRQLVYCDITPDGEYITIHGIADEMIHLIFSFNRTGSKLSHPSGDFQLSPSGNYFYSEENQTIYDFDFSSIKLPFKTLFHYQDDQYDYRSHFQILEDDIVLLFVTEYSRSSDPHRSVRQKQKITNSKMFIFDLKENSTLGTLDMKINEYEKYLLSKASFSNGWLSFLLYNGNIRETRLVTFKVANSTFSFKGSDRISNLLLSKQTPYLFISTLLKREGFRGYYAFSIYDLNNNQYLMENVNLDQLYSHVSSFTTNKNGIVFLYSAYNESYLRTSVFYTKEGKLKGKCKGWFNLEYNYGFIPLQNQLNPTEIDLLKINLEDLK